MRRALRTGLGACLIASLAWSGFTAVQLFGSGPARLWVDRETDRIVAELDRQLARVAGQERIGGRVSALLAEEPRNWLALDAVLAEAARLGVALPPDLAAQVEAARVEDHGWMARTGNCLRCAWAAERCSFDLVMLCRAPVELSPLGDIKGLAEEGGKYLRGEDVDEVVLILSAMGLSATALVVATGGGSVTVKAGAGLAKLARGMGAMPAWMARSLTNTARQGVNWAGIPGVRSVDDLMALLRPKVLRPAVKTLDDAGRLVGSAGAAGGLYLISRTADAGDLSKMARVSDAMDERTVGAFEMLGKSRVLRAAVRLSDETLALAISLATALAALAGLLLSAGSNAAIRAARRALR